MTNRHERDMNAAVIARSCGRPSVVRVRSQGGIVLRTKITLVVAALGLTLGLAAAAQGSRSASRVDPHGFTARVDNPWFPLRPGTKYHYTGIKDGKPSR